MQDAIVRFADHAAAVVNAAALEADAERFAAAGDDAASQAADADYVPASSASAIVNAGGLGRFSLVDFRKKMTGKQTSVSAFISQYDEGLSGTSTPVK